MNTLHNLGINTVNLEIEKALDLGLGRIELSLGKAEKYEDKLTKFKKNIDKIEKLKIPYSIHLPVYVEDWYKYDYFSAFFIDKDEFKRELSFRLLKHNLERLKCFSPDYFVLHFPGIDQNWDDKEAFYNVLLVSLERVQSIAKDYETKIYLEYFGSNKNFYDYSEWAKTIKNYDNLGILTDTGHLYFASIINRFDFLEALKVLADNSEAFHVWTTKGDKAYCGSKYYKKYHHITPHENQSKKEGWAFDTGEIMKVLASKNKPVIIEPSIRYKGADYMIEGIKSIKKYFEEEK
jgi:sugar phosphate isomerase/epimerase